MQTPYSSGTSAGPHLGGFSFASAGRTLRSPTQVEMNGTHEGAVASVCQGRHHQPSAVAQVLIPILHLSIHHTHWDAQVLRVIVHILAAVQFVRQGTQAIRTVTGDKYSTLTSGYGQEAAGIYGLLAAML